MAENRQEKIIAKVKKILELSRNNPSQEEAQAAALKAQELMAEYHIKMVDIEDIADADIDKIVEREVITKTGKKWKYQLASIVARNFRCKCYYHGGYSVVFYGYSLDAEIAATTFEYLFKVGNRASTSYYNKCRTESNSWYFNGTGIINTYLRGYLQGIQSVLDKQCTALMIVVPPEVKDGYAELTKDFRQQNVTLKVRRDDFGYFARTAGYEKGRDAMSSRAITQNA